MTVKSLLVKIGADVKDLEKGFGKANACIQKNADKIKKAGRTIAIGGAAIMGVMGGVIKAYASFDKKLNESLAIMGDVSDGMKKKMADAAKEMSGQSTFASKQLAEAYFFLASAGMDAKQSIAALPAVTKFAQAGNFNLALATDLLTDAQTALGLSSKDAQKNQENLIRVSDVLVKANTLANASVQQFSESLTNKAAAALVNVNKEMEEGVAVLAAYADKGVKGNIAGQRLTMMLNGLFQATQMNKGAWDDFGVSLWNSKGEMRPIADIIGDLEGKFKTLTPEQKQATLAQLGFNLKTKDSILTLMGSSEKIRQWTKDLKSAGGTTKDVAENQLKSLSNQLKLVKNKFVNTAISLGEKLAPAVIEIAGKIGKVIEKIQDWIKAHPKLTKTIMKVVAGVGALMTVLGPFLMMLPGLAIALSALTGPIGLIILGVAALVVATKSAISWFGGWKKSIAKSREELEKYEEQLGQVGRTQIFLESLKKNKKAFETFWWIVKEKGGNISKVMKQIESGKLGPEWKLALKAAGEEAAIATTKLKGLEKASGELNARLDIYAKAETAAVGGILTAREALSGTIVDQELALNSLIKAMEKQVEGGKQVDFMTLQQQEELKRLKEEIEKNVGAHLNMGNVVAKVNEKIANLTKSLVDKIAQYGETEYQTAKRHNAEKLADRIATINAEKAGESQRSQAIASARAVFRAEDAALDKEHKQAEIDRENESHGKKQTILASLYADKKAKMEEFAIAAKAAEDKHLEENAALIDGLKQMTMNRWDYENDLLDRKYKKEKKTSTNLGLLWKKYEMDKAALAQEQREAEDAARKASLEQALADVAMTLGAIGGLFGLLFDYKMQQIDIEEKRRFEAIDNLYNATIEANQLLLDEEQKKTEKILQSIGNDYDAKKQYILDNVADEQERNALLAALELEREDRLTQARTAREVAEQEAADALQAIEDAKLEAIEVAEVELEGKRKEARIKGAKQEKAVALLSAVVATAAAIVNALKLPFPLNLIHAAVVGAMGAVQIALIASKPIPMAHGALVTGPTEALIGEKGPELVIPLDRLPGELGEKLGRGRPGKKERSVEVSLQATFHINALDPSTMRDVVRDKIGPELIEFVRVGIGRTKMQEALL